MPIQDRCDLLVLGAGPAGSAAAIHARRLGLAVIVLDPRVRPVREPGETLHPGVAPILGQLGVLDEVLAATEVRHSGIWVEDQGSRTFNAYGRDADGPWLGLQVDRERLGEIFREALRREGADVRCGMAPESIWVEQGRIAGVSVAGGTVRACWTVDATGRRAWLARQMELESARLSPPMYARYGWRVRDQESCEPTFMLVDDGWVWQAPLTADRTAWVKLSIVQQGMSATGLDITWQHRDDCAGPGYFLAGDSALMLDPSSSHGILRALMTGILAAHAAHATSSASIPEGLAIQAYRDWIRLHAKTESGRLAELYEHSAAAPLFRSAGRNTSHKVV